MEVTGVESGVFSCQPILPSWVGNTVGVGMWPFRPFHVFGEYMRQTIIWKWGHVFVSAPAGCRRDLSLSVHTHPPFFLMSGQCLAWDHVLWPEVLQ